MQYVHRTVLLRFSCRSEKKRTKTILNWNIILLNNVYRYIIDNNNLNIVMVPVRILRLTKPQVDCDAWLVSSVDFKMGARYRSQSQVIMCIICVYYKSIFIVRFLFIYIYIYFFSFFLMACVDSHFSNEFLLTSSLLINFPFVFSRSLK